jgi:hypothetical protein
MLVKLRSSPGAAMRREHPASMIGLHTFGSMIQPAGRPGFLRRHFAGQPLLLELAGQKLCQSQKAYKATEERSGSTYGPVTEVGAERILLSWVPLFVRWRIVNNCCPQSLLRLDRRYPPSTIQRLNCHYAVPKIEEPMANRSTASSL